MNDRYGNDAGGWRASFLSQGAQAYLFCHPDEVTADRKMTTEQKRELLASWASDAHAVECAPALRQLHSGAVVKLDDILAALKALDRGPSTPAGRAAAATGGRRRRLLLRLRPDRRRQGRRPDDDGGDDPPPVAGAMRGTLPAA